MKTRTTTNNANTNFAKHNNSITHFIALLILFFSLVKGISQNQLPVQKGIMGVGLFSEIGANGYGTEYSPNVYYNKGRGSYFLAPTIQKRKTNLTGIQATFQYALTGKDVVDSDCKLELFVFLTAAYHHNAVMGRVTNMDEQIANPLYAENKIYNDRFNSAEAFAGIGLNIPFLKRFKWTNCIGVGGFTSFNFPTHLFYQGQNAGIFLRTGITMALTHIK